MLHPSTSKLTNAETATSLQKRTKRGYLKASLAGGASVPELSGKNIITDNYILNLNFQTNGSSAYEAGGDNSTTNLHTKSMPTMPHSR